MLRPQHFADGATRMNSRGLTLDKLVSHDDRVFECLDLGDTFDEVDQRLEGIASLRPPARLVINPPRCSAARLMARMATAQELSEKDPFNLTHGIGRRYERGWKRQRENDLAEEGQAIVLVAFDCNEPVGFVGFSVSLVHPDEPDRAYFLSFSFGLVYVVPVMRGKGFGVDLSVATGWIARDVLWAAYRAVPPRSTISPNLCADWETKGGEVFTYHIRDTLDFTSDIIGSAAHRTVTIDRTILDAGY